MINLISDTVTKPTKGMLKAMWNAEVGDDVFRSDPSVNALEEKAAALFGMEAGLYCPSGTMTNQIALKVHTKPLDEVICHKFSHIFLYEVAGYAFNSGIGVNLLEGPNGILAPSDIQAAIKKKADWLPISSLVVLENTCNRGGGTCYDLKTMKAVKKITKKNGLALHLDGARLFNAIVKKGYKAKQVGKIFDSISICLSKGLGAPVGSVLLGKKDFIQKARRVRKAMGGGMRQAGFIAAAGLYALEHQVERLADDHKHAIQLKKTLQECKWVDSIRPVETNILIFDIIKPHTAEEFVNYLNDNGIGSAAFGPQSVRLVTHLDVTKKMIKKVKKTLLNWQK